MKSNIFYLILLFIFTIPVKGQEPVKYNGFKQLESTIAVHPNNSNIMAAAVIEFPSTGRQNVIFVSTDNGSSWVQKKTVYNATDPVIEFDNAGNIFFSYLSRSNSEIYIIKSIDLGQTWSNPLQVSNAGITHDADKEWIAIDRSSNYIYLVWLEFGTSPELKFSKSTNGGNSFSTPTSLVSSVSGVFAPFIVTGDNGLIYITYAVLYNFNQSIATFDLKFAISTDYGLNFSLNDVDANLKAPGYFRGGGDDPFILKYVETDEERSFRIYAVPSMAVNNQNGNIYIIVNHREDKNFSPGLTDTDYSDLVLYRSTDNGTNWDQLRILDWENEGEDYFQNDGDQFFPSITIRGNDLNDIAVYGDFGELLHFNGVTWNSFQNETQGVLLLSVEIKNNIVVTVGINNPRAFIAVGRR